MKARLRVVRASGSQKALRRWAENLHPRDVTGRFAESGSGGRGSASPSPKPSRPRDTPVAGSSGSRSGSAPSTPARSGSAPSTRGQGADTPPPRAGAVRDLTDDEYAEHTRQIQARLDKAIKEGQETHLKHTLNSDGVTYTPERARQHREILDALWNPDAPQEGRAVFAGGLGGAGKSTVLRDHAGINPKEYITVNPDDVKEEMAKRGMVPEVDGVSPMESATLIHAESSHIANLLAQRALAERRNVIFDGTMSRRASVEQRLAQVKEMDYSETVGVFVDIPVESSVERALSRHRRGLERHRRGSGQGGRYVPPEVIRANRSSTSSSANREVFEGLREQMGGWKIYDNSVRGRAPQLVDSSTT